MIRESDPSAMLGVVLVSAITFMVGLAVGLAIGWIG
jgi:hypothetical protein